MEGRRAALQKVSRFTRGRPVIPILDIIAPVVVARLREQARSFTVLAYRNYDFRPGALIPKVGMSGDQNHGYREITHP